MLGFTPGESLAEWFVVTIEKEAQRAREPFCRSPPVISRYSRFLQHVCRVSDLLMRHRFRQSHRIILSECRASPTIACDEMYAAQRCHEARGIHATIVIEGALRAISGRVSRYPGYLRCHVRMRGARLSAAIVRVRSTIGRGYQRAPMMPYRGTMRRPEFATILSRRHGDGQSPSLSHRRERLPKMPFARQNSKLKPLPAAPFERVA